MHAHRVYILNRADDDCVIRGVAHHFHFIFFPAQEALINQDLIDRGSVQAGFAKMLVILSVIGHAAACTAQGEGRANNRGQANIIKRGHTLLHRLSNGGAWIFEAEPIHGFAKELAIFSHFNRRALGANHLYAKLVQDAHFLKRKRGVQAGLSAHRRQQRVGALNLNDLRDGLRCDGFDVGGIGHVRIGHDGGWI